MDLITLFCLILGVVMAVHMICTANFLPSKAPISLGLVVAIGFAAAVGMVVTSITGDRDQLMIFECASFCTLLAQSIYMWAHGYHLSAFVRQRFSAS